MREKTIVFVNINDPEWLSLNTQPRRDGWYDVAIWSAKDQEYILALDLYRDGMWQNTLGEHKKVIKWKAPLKMADSKGHPISDYDDAIKLAEKIIEGICDDYRMTYKDAVYGSGRRQEDAKRRCETLERQIGSSMFQRLTMGQVDAENVILTLRKQVTG